MFVGGLCQQSVEELSSGYLNPLTSRREAVTLKSGEEKDERILRAFSGFSRGPITHLRCRSVENLDILLRCVQEERGWFH